MPHFELDTVSCLYSQSKNGRSATIPIKRRMHGTQGEGTRYLEATWCSAVLTESHLSSIFSCYCFLDPVPSEAGGVRCHHKPSLHTQCVETLTIEDRSGEGGLYSDHQVGNLAKWAALLGTWPWQGYAVVWERLQQREVWLDPRLGEGVCL
jgi:hypothetical protein